MRPAEAEAQPDPSDIREALRLIHESGVLGEGKLSLLLDYLVEEELAGRGDRLKGYSIALDVFKRGEDFDPSIDSVVRVEMLRLRKALAQYHAQPDPAARVVINLAKGSYRPTFGKRAEDSAGRRTSGVEGVIRSFISAKRVAVASVLFLALAMLSIAAFRPFDADDKRLCSRPALSLRLDGFPPANQTQLQGFFSRILQTYPLVLTGAAPRRCPTMQHRLALTRLSGGEVQAALYQGNERTPYWAEAFAGENGDAELMMARVLYRVATPEGALVKTMLRREWNSNKDKRDYACHVNSYSYIMNWASGDPTEDLRCLKSAMEEKSPFSDTYSGYAVLAQLWNINPKNLASPERRAQKISYHYALDHALATDPTDCLALMVRLREYRRAGSAWRGQLAEVLELFDQHCDNNPLMLEQAAAARGFVFNEWNQSYQLLQRAIAISGFRHEYSNTYLANLFFMHRWAEAHEELEWMGIQGMWQVIFGQRMGDQAMISAGMQSLKSVSLNSYDDVSNYVDSLGYHPDVAAKFKAEFVGTFSRLSGK